MNILIIEDEELAVVKLQKTLSSVAPDAVVVGITDSVKSSLAWLRSHSHPDIILSDIELTDGQSFEIFRQMPIESMIIFTTSYDEFAMQAFKLNSVDYLLKPVQRTELATALTKYKRLYGDKQIPAINSTAGIEQLLQHFQLKKPEEFRRRFLVKNVQKLVSVNVEDIAYFYFDGKLNFFKTFSNQKFVVDYPLDELEKMLDPQQFFRTSRSYIVSVKSIARIEEYFGSRLHLQLDPENEKEALVSREKVTLFKNWLGR